jgi:hypothetical protein
MTRWLKYLIPLLVGTTLGLVYGWALSPIQYTDATPNILRADYRADYVLMVAEAHQREQNPATSARRLAMLGSEAPAKIVASALDYATKNNFTQIEIALLQGLLNAMQTYQP